MVMDLCRCFSTVSFDSQYEWLLIYHSDLGELLNDFILSRIANGVEGLAHCATGLSALESLGRFDQERVVKIVDTCVSRQTVWRLIP